MLRDRLDPVGTGQQLAAQLLAGVHRHGPRGDQHRGLLPEPARAAVGPEDPDHEDRRDPPAVQQVEPPADRQAEPLPGALGDGDLDRGRRSGRDGRVGRVGRGLPRRAALEVLDRAARAVGLGVDQTETRRFAVGSGQFGAACRDAEGGDAGLRPAERGGQSRTRRGAHPLAELVQLPVERAGVRGHQPVQRDGGGGGGDQRHVPLGADHPVRERAGRQPVEARRPAQRDRREQCGEQREYDGDRPGDPRLAPDQAQCQHVGLPPSKRPSSRAPACPPVYLSARRPTTQRRSSARLIRRPPRAGPGPGRPGPAAG